MANDDRDKTIVVSVTDASGVIKGTITYNINTHSIIKINSEPASLEVENLFNTIIDFFWTLNN